MLGRFCWSWVNGERMPGVLYSLADGPTVRVLADGDEVDLIGCSSILGRFVVRRLASDWGLHGITGDMTFQVQSAIAGRFDAAVVHAMPVEVSRAA